MKLPPIASKSDLVLVVEDNDSIREDLGALLRAEGYRVALAREGLDALEQLRWGLRPALILLDLRMKLMTGWEFRAEQKKDSALVGIPVVAMTTGQWKPEDMIEFVERLQKPIDVEALREVLSRFCKPSLPRAPVLPDVLKRSGAFTARDIESGRARQEGPPVLVVDDSHEIRISIRDLLEGEGFSVLEAGNGQEALDLMRVKGMPCLILLDLAMPVMDGWTLLAIRRQDNMIRRVPIIILSAFSSNMSPTDDGAVSVLSKPIDPVVLINAVRAHCSTKPVPRPAS